MRRELFVLILIVGMLAAGCAAVVAGAGAGAGVYSYMSGELTTSYQAGFDRTYQAALDSLDDLKMTVIEKPTGDAINSVIKAERSDGTPVSVRLKMAAPNLTEVGVRSGVVGVWDKQVSKLVHVNIAKRLQ
jgi:hypothetical protein